MWKPRAIRGRRWGAAGYTLSEIAMGLTITAILGGISMPSMIGMIQRYRANAGPRQVLADLRFAQYQAISRGMQARLVIFDTAGQATGAGYTDTTKANKYRLEVRPTGGVWPALADTPATTSNVLTVWLDLAADYRQAVAQANAVVFTSRGSLQNSVTSLDLVLQTVPGGATHRVRAHPSGQVEVL